MHNAEINMKREPPTSGEVARISVTERVPTMPRLSGEVARVSVTERVPPLRDA